MQIADADGIYLDVEASMMNKIALALGLQDQETEEITQSVHLSQSMSQPASK